MGVQRGTRKPLGGPQFLAGVAALLLGLLGAGSLHASPFIPPRQQTYAVVRGRGLPGAPTRAVQGATAPARVNCGQQACLAITFDDGPNPAVTPQILDVLERHHVHATFFLIGRQVPGNEALLRRMYQGGNELGNHSWSHPDFTTLSAAQIEQQFAQTQAVISAAGVPAPTLFRPPYGAVNALVKSQIPLTFALWNDDTEDWKVKDAKKIQQEVEANARPGRVILLHDIYPQTVEALDPLLNDLQQHYQLVTFSQLFNINPGQRGLFYGR